VEIAAEIKDIICLVEATFQVAPNRMGGWGLHCSKVDISTCIQKICGREDGRGL